MVAESSNGGGSDNGGMISQCWDDQLMVGGSASCGRIS
jgi:hypothetical protein